jgi:hypothetical protein
VIDHLRSSTDFERLFVTLSQSCVLTGKTLSGLRHLTGYFEDAENSTFCLLACPNVKVEDITFWKLELGID